MELLRIGFAVEFLLDHLQEISQALFMRKIQSTVDAIDTRIENLKKEVADLEAYHERLLSNVTGPTILRTRLLFSTFDPLDVYLL